MEAFALPHLEAERMDWGVALEEENSILGLHDVALIIRSRREICF